MLKHCEYLPSESIWRSISRDFKIQLQLTISECNRTSDVRVCVCVYVAGFMNAFNINPIPKESVQVFLHVSWQHTHTFMEHMFGYIRLSA